MGEYILGIDPGASGAYAMINVNTREVIVESFKDFKTTVDFFHTHSYNIKACAIEQVGGFIGVPQPGSRMFNFGMNYGFFLGLLESLDIEYVLVRPQAWQKEFSGRLKGLKGPLRKRVLKEIAIEKFPNEKVTLKNCDALLIARELYNKDPANLTL